MFWAKVVYATIYILNRCPIRAVVNKTLIEAWSRWKPLTKHLRVFNCIYYNHILDKKRKKERLAR